MRTAKQLDQVIALLASLFPNTFALFQERRKPLKLGIHLDLESALGEVELLPAALGHYCRNIAYMRSQRAGAKRIDLDGNDAGEVTAEQAANAEKAVAGLRAAAWKRKQAKAVIVEPVPKPLARDGMSALRAAARRRATAA